MALQTLNDEGQMEWHCPCGQVNTAHHSHEQVEYTGPHVVALPPCGNCGARMFLNAHFSEQDLRAPNMIDEDGNTTPSYDVAHRHMELHRRLQASGKRYEEPPPPESLDALVQREVARALEGLRSRESARSPEMPPLEAPGEGAEPESPEAAQQEEEKAHGTPIATNPLEGIDQ